ncbi:MAG: hypothetical protein HKN64_00805, partial [Woeseiaceae bacterium]|nr:hypothetical protein [Woeseiaceae bacterium]
DAEDRDKALQDAMYRYLSTRLIEHGFKGDDAAIRSVIEIDVQLNAAGLVSWLNRLDKADQDAAARP